MPEAPNKICPLMLISKSQRDLSDGVPEGSISGDYTCLGSLCMAFRESNASCGFLPISAHEEFGDKFE